MSVGIESNVPDQIPDDIATRVAIASAERDITRGRGETGFYSLRKAEKRASEMVAYSALLGDSLAEIRAWAIHVALIRDARRTVAELRAVAA